MFRAEAKGGNRDGRRWGVPMLFALALPPLAARAMEPDIACCRVDGQCDVTNYTVCVDEGGDPQPPGLACGSAMCEPIVWSQPPRYPSGSGGAGCFAGWSAQTLFGGEAILADDFLLPAGTAISRLRWWGAHVGSSTTTPPADGFAWFHIGFWSHVPAGTGLPAEPWDRPGSLLWARSVPRAALQETMVGCVPASDELPDSGAMFRYQFDIAEAERFPSGGGGRFWLTISASAFNPLCECHADVTPPGGAPDPADVSFISAHAGCAVGAGDPACDASDVDCNGVVESRDVSVAQCQMIGGWNDPGCCVALVNNPWGWTTRVDTVSAGAVKVTSPAGPPVGANYLSGARLVTSQGAPANLTFVLNGVSGGRVVPAAPLPEANGSGKNRYVTFDTPAEWSGREVAVRVRLVSLDRFPAFNGEVRWVGSPVSYSDNPTGSFAASPLQCVPTFLDWSTHPRVHVYGSPVVPLSQYQLQAVDRGCENTLSDETCYSAPLVVTTNKWGDVIPPLGGGSQPNFGDVTALVDKFRSLPTSIPRVRAQLRPNVVAPGNPITFLDVSDLVGAFQGRPFPFAGPIGCP